MTYDHDFRYEGTYKSDGRSFFLILRAKIKNPFASYDEPHQQRLAMARLIHVDARPDKLVRPLSLRVDMFDENKKIVQTTHVKID